VVSDSVGTLVAEEEVKMGRVRGVFWGRPVSSLAYWTQFTGMACPLCGA